MPMREVFLDASYAIALAARSDQYHARAVALAKQMEAARTQIVTTHAVLLEIGNALSKHRYRHAATILLDALLRDPRVETVALDGDLFAHAFALFQDRPDKEWGLTDCVSFVVMQRRGLSAALTADDHFRQAGFRVLLDEG